MAIDSLFTKIIQREIPATIILETDTLIVIKDINPQAPIHFLIITKKPIKNIQDMTGQDFFYVIDIFAMAQRLSREISGAEEFKLIMNNGKKAGQCVFHMHVHFLAGY